MSRTWQTYDINGNEEVCVVEAATNDNLDRGYSSESAYWTLEYRRRGERTALELAKRLTGQCRIGANGCLVTVRCNGEFVGTPVAASDEVPDWEDEVFDA